MRIACRLPFPKLRLEVHKLQVVDRHEVRGQPSPAPIYREGRGPPEGMRLVESFHVQPIETWEFEQITQEVGYLHKLLH